jgi:hypothetical protein
MNRSVAISAVIVAWLAATAAATAQDVRTQAPCSPITDKTQGGVAINFNGGCNIIGVPAEQLERLVHDRTKDLQEIVAAHKATIDLLNEKLDLNARQVRAALLAAGEKDVPPVRLAAVAAVRRLPVVARII